MDKKKGSTSILDLPVVPDWLWRTWWKERLPFPG